MSKFKIVNLIDKVFVSVSVFLILYAWINFYVKNLWLTFILSLIFSSACVFILFYVFEKRKTKTLTATKNKDEINKTFLAFKLSSAEQKINLFAKFYSSSLKTELESHQFVVVKNNKPCLVIFETEKETITQNDIYNILSKQEQKFTEIDVVCENFASNLKLDVLKNVKINLINKLALYNLCSLNSIFPEFNNINWETTKLKFKDILIGFFVPQKAKSYFLCGLVLIFSAIILPYHVYYLIFGSMLLIFSVICKLKGNFY